MRYQIISKTNFQGKKMKKTVETPSPTVELIKNLKDADDNIKLYSISQLPQIAHILGPARLTAELLPYLQELLNDEENILIKLCQALSYIKIPPSNSILEIFLPKKKMTDRLLWHLQNILRKWQRTRSQIRGKRLWTH